MRDDNPNDLIGQLIRFGTVKTVDLSAAKVTVTIGDIETQPIRWLHGAAGGTSSWSPPTVGEQVVVFTPEGDIGHAFALRGIHFDDFPAAGDSKRELIKFDDGAVIAYDPEAHKLEAVLPDGATVSIVAPGGVTIDADVRITGDLQVDGKIHADSNVEADGDVKAGNISLTHHKHPGVQAGASQTQEPV